MTTLVLLATLLVSETNPAESDESIHITPGQELMEQFKHIEAVLKQQKSELDALEREVNELKKAAEKKAK